MYGILKDADFRKKIFGREIYSTKARLFNHGLFINERCGYYTIKRSQNDYVEGELIELNDLELKIADKLEGVSDERGNLYERVIVYINHELAFTYQEPYNA